MQELVLFQTGDMDFAIQQDCIMEIRSLAKDAILTRECLQQVIETGDGLLILIDLASGVAHCTPPVPAADARLILVKGTPPYALLADGMHKTMEADPGQMETLPPVFEDTARACFPKVLRTQEQLALVIDTIALAQCKIEIDAVPDQWWAQQLQLEDDQETLTTAVKPAATPSSPSVPDALEIKIGEILRKIIEQGVKKKVAESLAQTLETSFG
jgi:chemotaxis signal transduction protein